MTGGVGLSTVIATRSGRTSGSGFALKRMGPRWWSFSPLARRSGDGRMVWVRGGSWPAGGAGAALRGAGKLVAGRVAGRPTSETIGKLLTLIGAGDDRGEDEEPDLLRK